MTERTDELANEVAAKVVADELKQAVEEEAEAEAATAPTFEVILASSSPRRRELLDAAGVKFTVRTPATPVDESLEPDLAADPEEAAKKLAERKAGAVIQEVLAENYIGMLIVIGADTMVVLDGKIFGKPRSASDGKHMLRQLSGRTHEVITAVSVWMVAAPNAEDVSLGFRTFADISHVTFRDLTDEEITEYLRGRRAGGPLRRLPRHHHRPACDTPHQGIPRPRERRGRRMLSDQCWLSLAVA